MIVNGTKAITKIETITESGQPNQVRGSEMGIKKKHPQGVEQFADSHNTQANATPHENIITLEGQMFEGKEHIYEK